MCKMRSELRIQTPVGELEVSVIGENVKPTALLWHSLFVDSRSWHRVEDDLAEDRRLVIVTGPGHGDSADPGRRYTTNDCADAAVTILDRLDVSQPVDWVGNAWGGHVGIIVAARYPERCRTLVTVGTPVHAYTRAGRLRTALLVLLYRLLGPRRFLVDAVTDVLLSEQTRAHDPAAVELVRDSFTRADRVGLVNAVTSISLLRPDLTPLLPGVAAPTLFVTGTGHSDWSSDQATNASRMLPHGSVEVLEGAAYLGPLETPGEFTRLLRNYWATHAPSESDLS